MDRSAGLIRGERSDTSGGQPRQRVAGPRRGVYAAIALLIGSVLGSGTAAQAAGAWVAKAQLPDIRQRGLVYRSPVLAPSPGMAATGQGIRRVRWRYGYDSGGIVRPRVQLCAASRCVDANMARGHSDAFAGLPVATSFRLWLRVPGDGRISQRLGPGDIQLVVDFD